MYACGGVRARSGRAPGRARRAASGSAHQLASMLLLHAWTLAATSSVLCVAVVVAPQVARVVVIGGDTAVIGGEDELLLLRLAAQEVRRYTYATGGGFPTIQHLRTLDARRQLLRVGSETNSTSAVVMATAAAATTLFDNGAGGDGPDVTPDVTPKR